MDLQSYINKVLNQISDKDVKEVHFDISFNPMSERVDESSDNRIIFTVCIKNPSYNAYLDCMKRKNYMTGQEWYGRFKEEMGEDANNCTGCSCDAVEAALKAAGL